MILLLYSIGKNTISNRLKILNNKIEAKKVKFELQNKNEKVVFYKIGMSQANCYFNMLTINMAPLAHTSFTRVKKSSRLTNNM